MTFTKKLGMMMEKNFDEIKKRIETMPVLSQGSMRLLDIIADPDHSLQDIVRIIETDMALTAQILKSVNSAAFGLANSIKSVARAAAYLGDKTIAGIAIAYSQAHIYNSALEGYQSHRGALWTHSLRTAIGARELANLSQGAVTPEVAYTAGILHDIGKAILSDFMAGKLQDILAEADTAPSPNFIQAEQQLLGTNHCEAGYELARHWRLAEEYCAVCAHHHAPGEARDEHRALVSVVHLADAISMMGGSGTGADGLMYSIDPIYENYINITADQLNGIVLQTTIEFEKAKSLLFPHEE